MKNGAKRIVSFIMSFVILITMFQATMLNSSAKVIGPDNKVELTFSTDKSKYSKGDTIEFTVNVKNVTDEALKGIIIKSFARNTFKLSNYNEETIIYSLNPGESTTVNIKYSVNKLSGFTALFFPLIWLFNPSARNNYKQAEFNYEEKVKIGSSKYKIGFEVEYNSEDYKYDLRINQSDFTTKDIDTNITGTINPIEGIDSITYINKSEDNATSSGVAIIDGNNWEIPLKLMTGKNNIKIIAKPLEGKEITKEINITYNIGTISIPTQSEISEENGLKYRKGVLSVYFKNNVSEDDINNFIESKRGNIIGENYFLNMFQVKFDITSYSELENKANEIQESQLVKSAIIDEIIEDASITVNDPWNGDVNETDWNDEDVDGSNWGLEAIDIKSVWENNERLSKQPSRVGIVDSGINLNHSEFSNRNDNINVKLVNDGGHNYSGSDHGSHVAGIIGASPNNSTGITGVNWNTDILFGSAGYNGGHLDGSLISDTFVRSVINGAKVINFSMGSFSKTRSRDNSAKTAVLSMSSLLEDGFDFLCVQSAGNDNDKAIYNGWFCALYNEMNISYATNRLTARDLINHTILFGAAKSEIGNYGYALDTEYSNYGDKVDIVAPGTHIYSCYYNGFGYMSGTSMAAPFVTATVGLVWSANNELSMTEIKNIICSSSCTTNAYDYSRNTSYRMLNAGLAVQKAFNIADAVGIAHGNFVDASNGQKIASGTYIIHKDLAEGEIIDRKTFTNGSFNFSAHAGRYVLEINGDGGYVTRYLTVVIVPDETINCGDVPLSKQLESNKIRIVLSWGEYPSDLDSHIVGKTKQGNNFHVAYYDKVFNEEGESAVFLDWDDTSSYGPETVTVIDLDIIDNFKYLVHNYSYRYSGSEDEGAFSLSDSRATVDVYRGTALIASYSVPVNRKGTVWNVFEMNALGQITSINTMSFESEPHLVGEN